MISLSKSFEYILLEVEIVSIRFLVVLGLVVIRLNTNTPEVLPTGGGVRVSSDRCLCSIC